MNLAIGPLLESEGRTPKLPLSELLEDNTVGEALTADTDSLQHAIAPQLIQDQMGIQFTSLGKRKHLLMSQQAKKFARKKKLKLFLSIIFFSI